MANNVYIKGVCKCKGNSEEELSLVREIGYYKSMGFFRVIFHMIMVALTGGGWLGWLISGHFLSDPKYQCVHCEEMIDSTALRV